MMQEQHPTIDIHMVDEENLTTTDDSSNNLIYVEDLSPDLQAKFIESCFNPYFKNVFADLVLRSSPCPNKKQSIDKVTLIEFIQLPGIIADRFYALCSQDSDDGRVTLDPFLKLVTLVYCSQLEQKMGLAFRIYDFDCDGKISAEDVNLVISYIPQNKKDSLLYTNLQSNATHTNGDFGHSDKQHSSRSHKHHKQSNKNGTSLAKVNVNSCADIEERTAN